MQSSQRHQNLFAVFQLQNSAQMLKFYYITANSNSLLQASAAK